MVDMINGKTPDEIKKGLECRIRGVNEKCDYRCDKCDVYIPGYNLENRYSDAFAYIQHLESRLAQAERERDAAVTDIRNAKWMLCHVCKNYYRPDPAIRHYACKAFGEFSKFLNPSDFSEDGYDFPSLCGKFKWRGVCAENTKGENAP